MKTFYFTSRSLYTGMPIEDAVIIILECGKRITNILSNIGIYTTDENVIMGVAREHRYGSEQPGDIIFKVNVINMADEFETYLIMKYKTGTTTIDGETVDFLTLP